MTYAFRFEYNGKLYDVVGDYASGEKEGFSVAVRLHKSELPSPLGANSGGKLERPVAAASKAELMSKLEASYPGLSNFAEC